VSPQEQNIRNTTALVAGASKHTQICNTVHILYTSIMSQANKIIIQKYFWVGYSTTHFQIH